jgi:glutamine amidotransferase|tara:strand:- start:282 stop:914 length:633 start_codon:yes stop_codon:yes gene_type:complete
MNIKNTKIIILDYGSGNVRSVANSLNHLNLDHKISNNNEDLEQSTHIILPGVGSYGASIEKIKKKIDISFLKNEIFLNKKFFLGICVGMQVLSTKGYEFDESVGLDFISGKVTKINTKNLPTIHTGWNEINIINKECNILDGLSNKSTFYFTHGYKFELSNDKHLVSNTNYNECFPSIIQDKNIYGVQFHPEKSQDSGLKLLSNFAKLVP